MRFAYISTERPIESVAQLMSAYSGGRVDERDGLNRGGGQYFLVSDQASQLALCWAEHYADPPDPRFRYCIYVLHGPMDVLDKASDHLTKQGLEVAIA
jgi:hypothetical protein